MNGADCSGLELACCRGQTLQSLHVQARKEWQTQAPTFPSARRGACQLDLCVSRWLQDQGSLNWVSMSGKETHGLDVAS